MTSRRGGGGEGEHSNQVQQQYVCIRKSQQPSEGCRRESKGKRGGVTADVEERRNLEVGKTLALRSLAKQLGVYLPGFNTGNSGRGGGGGG
jgi:hypothetical protein